MKRILPSLLLLMLLAASTVMAQPSTFMLEHECSDGPSSGDLVERFPGRYLTSGNCAGTSYVAEMDQYGTFLWANTCPFDIYWLRLFPRADSSFYAVGMKFSPSAGQLIAGLYDANGNNQWLRVLCQAQTFEWVRGGLLGNGNLVVVGSAETSGVNTYAGALDDQGTLLWETQFAVTGRAAVATMGQADAFVAMAGGTDSYLTRLDGAGQEVWTRKLINVSAKELTLMPDGNLYLGCQYGSNAMNAALWPMDTLGNSLPEGYDLSNLASPELPTFTPDGRLLVTGILSTWTPFGTLPVYRFGILDPATMRYGDEGVIEDLAALPSRVQVTPDGGYLLRYHSTNGNSILKIMKVAPDISTACDTFPADTNSVPEIHFSSPLDVVGRLAPSGHYSLSPHSTQATTLPFVVRCSSVGVTQPVEPLAKVWPNPAVDQVNLAWQPSAFHANKLEVSLWNSAGMRLQAWVAPNTGSAAMALTGLPRGAYFLRLQGNGVSRRVMVVKE